MTLRRVFDRPGSVLVQVIDELLSKHKVRVGEVTGIVVATGPGPFSAIRAGVSVANTFGYVLRVPVVSMSGDHTLEQLLKQGAVKLKRAKIGTIVTPTYGQLPNITKPGRRR